MVFILFSMLFQLWNFLCKFDFLCKFCELDQNWKKGNNLNINCHKAIKFTVYYVDTMIITFCPLMYYEIFTHFAVFEKNIIPHIPLAGLDDDILDNAKEIGLGKFLPKIEKFGKMKFNSINTINNEAKKIAKESEHTKKSISIVIGPNNIHDILDSLELEH